MAERVPARGGQRRCGQWPRRLRPGCPGQGPIPYRQTWAGSRSSEYSPKRSAWCHWSHCGSPIRAALWLSATARAAESTSGRAAARRPGQRKKERTPPGSQDHGIDAKKAVARLRTSTSSRSDLFSRRSRGSSARSSLVSPGRSPASVSAWATQARTAVSVRSKSRDPQTLQIRAAGAMDLRQLSWGSGWSCIGSAARDENRHGHRTGLTSRSCD